MIYPSSAIERQHDVYSDMLLLSRFKRVYLNELKETDEINIGLLKLVVEPEETAIERSRKLVAKSSLVELDFIEQIKKNCSKRPDFTSKLLRKANLKVKCRASLKLCPSCAD